MPSQLRQVTRSVMTSEASPQEAADYYKLCFLTTSGIDDAISILNVRKVSPSTSANELRLIDFLISKILQLGAATERDVGRKR